MSLRPLIVVVALAMAALAQQPPAREQTDTEILYRGRYTNCDAGYSVILPAGAVAHRDRSAAVNRGFQIDLSDPQGTHSMSYAANRYLAVSNLYNSQEFRSLSAIVSSVLDQEQGDRADFDLVEQLPVKLAGLPASHFRARFKNKTSRLNPEKMIEEGIIAFRPEEHGHGNVIYELLLVSPEATYPADKLTLDRLTASFRLQDFSAPCE